jgi:hypothetical protein
MSTKPSGTELSSARVGSLGRSDANWMSRNAHKLVDSLPRPGVEWRWGDVEIDQGTLMVLRDRNMISRASDRRQTWVTPRSTIRAIADYGRVDVDNVGIPVDEMRRDEGQSGFDEFGLCGSVSDGDACGEEEGGVVQLELDDFR